MSRECLGGLKVIMGVHSALDEYECFGGES